MDAVASFASPAQPVERKVSVEGGEERTYILATVDDYSIAYELAQDAPKVTLHELSHAAQQLKATLLTMVTEAASETHGDADPCGVHP